MKNFALSALALAAIGFAAPANAATYLLDVDVSGVLSNDEQGSPINTILEIALPTDAVITGIAFDVTLFADSPSWLSEMVVAFLDSPVGLQLTPGVGETFSGTGTYSSGGIIDLASIDPTFPFAVTDGFLTLEFYESFDDFFLDFDGVWESGTLTFQYESDMVPGGLVPEPATWAMMIGGFGLVGGALRRRASTSVTYA